MDADASNEEKNAAGKAKRLTIDKLHPQLRLRSNHDLNRKTKHQGVHPHDLVPYCRKIEPGAMCGPAAREEFIHAFRSECHAPA